MNTRLEQLKALTAQFEANIGQYKSAAYDESNTRTDFIDKLFALLDWDISNSQGFSEAYREVVREDKVSIDGTKKAPDCSFRIGGIVKFFEEAKKPSVTIKEAGEPAFQLRRYGWTKKLPLSILTNFAEFAVYDTRIKPNKDDSASVARIFYCTYKEYEQHFDFLYNTFSKNAILKGSFDRYVEENKNKKGTSEVDDDLLHVIEAWRVELAKNIALRNPAISMYNLNTSVQKIIDRIIFLRIAEDKGIEDENLLLTIAKTQGVYEKLILIFKKADIKYNSGLFLNIDWIDTLVIDDKVLSNIIVNLYYPECPYEFSVLPVEILGSIYERFLGKTIHFKGVKGGHTAIIEEKPEVKKAGGVFYTPQYIVDYITQNTVGEKIRGKSPEEIAALRICDPACGSGSFLVGAYQYLLQYHLDWYTQKENIKAAMKKEKIYEAGFNSYKLTITEKQKILTNNIFGVDIDPQAVEVTKLSLYLKLLENEGKEANERLFKYSDLTLLPSLEENIKCGNSLIGSDFYNQKTLGLTEDEQIKINCFDWEKEFPAIFKNGGMDAAVKKIGEFAEQTQNIETDKDVGFDVVIGNPPYVRPHKIEKYVKNYFWENFKTFVAKSDMYCCFIEKGVKLLKQDGIHSFITPQTWMSLESFTAIRKYILDNCTIHNLTQLPKKVFADATVETCIFVIKKNKSNSRSIVHIYNLDSSSAIQHIRKFPQKDIFDTHLYNFQIYSRNSSRNIINKIKSTGVPLENFVKLLYGFKTGDDQEFISMRKINKKYKPFIRSADVARYWNKAPNEYVLYEPDVMIKHNSTARPGDIDRFLAEKIIVARMGKNIMAAYNSSGLLVKDAMLLLSKNGISLKYILAIINSSLMNYYYQEYFITIDVLKNALLSLPIAVVDLSDKPAKAAHDNLVSLVDTMLALKQKEAAEPNADMKKIISRQIDGVDALIDKAVYALYGLTAEEIKTVEGE